LPPELGVQAERHGENAENTHRHHASRHDRHGEKIGEHAIGRDAMKMTRAKPEAPMPWKNKSRAKS